VDDSYSQSRYMQLFDEIGGFAYDHIKGLLIIHMISSI
jgi:hypothetical protein